MACWHNPAPYNTCWRCDYVRDYYNRIRISWPIVVFFIAVVLAMIIFRGH